MIQIVVNDATGGYLAAEWCEKNLVFEDWEMWLSESSWSQYTFQFKNDKDATLFALTWAQYTTA
jgi:hypothetical protein